VEEAVKTCPFVPTAKAFHVVEATRRLPVVVANPAISERIFGKLRVQVGEEEVMVRLVIPYWVEVAKVMAACLPLKVSQSAEERKPLWEAVEVGIENAPVPLL
jgi:hypothetical protein